MVVHFLESDGGRTKIAVLSGRLDAAGAAQVEPELQALTDADTAILELSGVDYLSSAGVRVFLTLFKSVTQNAKRFVLVGLQPYCHEVIKISGLDETFLQKATLEEALSGSPSRQFELPSGSFTFDSGSGDAGTVEVLGHIEDVLTSRINDSSIVSKTFSSTEYSIGLGALGPGVEEVMPYLGEMMTIGGTMVWLPTDGNDTPDFLVPAQDSAEVVIRTGFNVSLVGPFNEYAEFHSSTEEGATISEIYRGLFDLARNRRPDYRGAIGLAMRAEMSAVYGSGVTKSPILANAPANGRMITDTSNFSSWFEFDESPRHHDVTGLICGIGLDLDSDLAAFDAAQLAATFYINPANMVSSREMLHNHGVFFSPQPLGDRPLKLEKEIARVVELGDFVDMRHLLDRCRIVWALVGVIYIQDFHSAK